MRRDRRAPSRRRHARVAAVAGALLAVSMLVTGCSMLGLDNSADPVGTSVATSAARVAAETGPAKAPVTVPSLETGTKQTTVSVQAWDTNTSTSAPPTTSEAPLTAPTVTHTITFQTFTSVTQPTTLKPSLGATPPPVCYGSGDCPAVASTAATGGTIAIVSPPDGSNTVAILLQGNTALDSLYVGRLPSPGVSCSGSYCLVQGSSSGLVFADLITINGGRLNLVSDQLQSTAKMRLATSGSGGLMVTGRQAFDDYGLPPADAPQASVTWVLGSGELIRTGCGTPVLYGTPSTPGDAVSGPCDGTPQIAGRGAASAHPILPLGGFATPSGNIQCAVVPGTQLACTIKSHTFKVATCTKPVKEIPASLRGVRVMLGKSGGTVADGCLGYTLIGSPATPISYGRLAAGDGFVCDVESSGVTCTGPSGRGFTLSTSGIAKR